MARTFRKRGYVPDYIFTEHEYAWVDGRFIHFKYRLEGKSAKKALARFHSDHGTGPDWMKSDPRWWRNTFERKDRRRTRREILNFYIDPNYEVQLHDLPPKSWYW